MENKKEFPEIKYAPIQEQISFIQMKKNKFRSAVNRFYEVKKQIAEINSQIQERKAMYPNSNYDWLDKEIITYKAELTSLRNTIIELDNYFKSEKYQQDLKECQAIYPPKKKYVQSTGDKFVDTDRNNSMNDLKWQLDEIIPLIKRAKLNESHILRELQKLRKSRVSKKDLKDNLAYERAVIVQLSRRKKEIIDFAKDILDNQDLTTKDILDLFYPKKNTKESDQAEDQSEKQ